MSDTFVLIYNIIITFIFSITWEVSSQSIIQRDRYRSIIQRDRSFQALGGVAFQGEKKF